MRKILVMGASALAFGLVSGGAAMADDMPANAVKLTLGGGAVENFGYVGNPSGKNTGLDQAFVVGSPNPGAHGTRVLAFGDAWLTFDGKGKLDNGISVEVNMQLNGSSQTEGGDCTGNATSACANKAQFENEADWIAFSGTFGRVEIGDDFNPAANYRFGNGAPYYGTSGMDWPRHTGWIVGPNGNSGVVGNQQQVMMDDYESTKLIYQTPVFAGFQVSASYTPSIGAGDNYNISSSSNIAGGDQYMAMAAYKNTFGDFSVNADIDYGVEQLFGQTAISGGLNLGYKGFTIGGAIADRMANNGGAVCGSNCAAAVQGLTYKAIVGAGTVWDIGVGYANGPWGVAFAYAHDSAYATGRTDTIGNAVHGNDTLTNYALTGKYTIGPGVDLSVESGLLYYREPTGVSADQVDGGYVLLGTELNF